MNPISRREFLSRKGLGQVLEKMAPLLGMSESSGIGAEGKNPLDADPTSSDERTVMADYFSSPIYSYALLSEMPWDMLIDEAKRFGIPYEGRSKLDVVRELFIGTGGKEAGL